MNRIGFLVLLSLSAGLGTTASAQEGDAAAYVYEAFYRIGMSEYGRSAKSSAPMRSAPAFSIPRCSASILRIWRNGTRHGAA